MKISILFIIVCLVFISTTFSQTMNKMVHDTTVDQKVLIDYCDRTGLESGEFGEYYLLEYEDYQINDSLLNLIRKKIKKFDITIVFGSWCSDSEQQVPHFYKILDQSGYDDDQLKIIAVNRQKKAKEVQIEDLQIELVPTFIIYKNGTEIGRIVETPNETLEEDLWQIIK
ncbi:MAG: thioredoxin family protein [Bacteroidales bacterium]|nr:thioredoxin family protein [Bacteroidales bacterium]